MSQFPSMPLFAGDMLADTEHLTNEEFGVYHRLLYAMWRRNGWVPDDDYDLARICHMGIRHWRTIKPRMMQFLVRKDGELSQKKLLKVRAKCDLISTISRKNINQRWHPDSKENNDMAYTAGHTESIHRARDSKTKSKSTSFNGSALPPSLALGGRSEAAPAPEEALTAEDIAAIKERLSWAH